MRADQWMPAAVELRRVVEPQRIFQSVAAGLLGRASYEGGVLSLHYFIDATMSVTYYVVARRWAALRAQPVVYGGHTASCCTGT